MDDEDYPNFAHAWTAPPAPWNPALRPGAGQPQPHGHSKKASVSSVDDFFARYPGPTPEKSRLPSRDVVETDAEGEDALEEPESPTRRTGVSVQPGAASQSPDEESINVAEGTGLFQHASEAATRVDAPATLQQPELAPTLGGDATTFTSAELLEERNTDVAEIVPESALGNTEMDVHSTILVSAGNDESKPVSAATSYEHQGEITELDEAVDEAPATALMADPAAFPEASEPVHLHLTGTANEVSEVSDVEGDATSEQGIPQSGDPHRHIERSFTTNFTEGLGVKETIASNTETVDNQWPSIGDDKTFGELLDGAGNPAPREEEDAELQEATWQAFDGDETFTKTIGSADTAAERDMAGTSIARPTQTGGEPDMAAAWQAALDDDELLDESNELDPSTLFGDDDDGFLEDDMMEPPFASDPAALQPASQPLSGQTGGHNHARAGGTPQTGLFNLYNQPDSVQQPSRPGLTSAASFADKSKGGYQSPYDLPMDVVKQPRQRPRQAPSTPQEVPTPPPRTTSFGSQPPHPSSPSTSTFGPPSQSRPPTGPLSSNTPFATTPRATPRSEEGFFADLPMTIKARPRPSSAYAPQSHSGSAPVGQFSEPQSSRATPLTQQIPSRPAERVTTQLPRQQSAYAGLRQPDRLPLLPEQPNTPQSSPPLSVGSPPKQRLSPGHQQTQSLPQNRFSPAPVTNGPPSNSRYSPVSGTQPAQPRRQPSANAMPPPGVQNAHPFAPRTSSPLAQPTEKQRALYAPGPSQVTPSSPPRYNGILSPPRLPSEQSISASYGSSPPSLGSSLQRVSTHSPPTAMKAPRPLLQAAEVATPVAAVTSARSSTLSHRRQFSREVVYAAPSDDHAHDPLQRWKGHPIFRWGDSGKILHSLPKQTPFWAAGQSIPHVKCTPGPVTIQDASFFMPMDDRNAKFPGPLTARAKGRKKEVLNWMGTKIDDLQRCTESVKSDFQVEEDAKKRADEKLVLWKLMRVFVEHDGSLESNPKTDEELRAILLPDLAQMGQVVDLQSPISVTATGPGDPANKNVILQLRQALLEGQRERAVWLAEDQKLWGHAMLIAATLSSDVWKKTVQAFVRSQVKTAGSDVRSLAALYQVFAGNAEECADELVPPSSRSGHQFIDLSGTMTNNPLVGLDSWRETLGMIASNRTPNDASSLLSLGQLLSQYGRAEAAHACFLFARQALKHSGADDAEAHFVLLGSNHKGSSEALGNDLDSIVLTEIYEWASSLSAPSVTAYYVPHLQSYKLIHAQQLAASGLKSQAQSYCDHITTAYSSTTKPSPYYHPSFTQAVSDLHAFLSQTPQSGPQGLLSRGAMNKVHSSASSWFTKFVAGEDDKDSTSSSVGGAGDELSNGPFSRVSGDSPVMSRAGSTADLYGSMNGTSIPYAAAQGLSTPPQSFQPSSAPGRYAPSGVSRYAPNTPLGGLGLDAKRPATTSAKSYAPATMAGLGVARPDVDRAASDYGVPYVPGPRRGSAQSHASYEPRPVLGEETGSYGYTPPIPEQPEFPQFTAYDEMHAVDNANGDTSGIADDELGGYIPPTSSYEPPSTSYEPQSYQPYEPEPPSANDQLEDAPKPRRNMMDDDNDDDLAKRAATMQKSEADRKADEAFRKAAEADAARDGNKAEARGSWFGGVGGWFKKDPNTQPQGPIRAKLGEENSFVYDEALKKWVNKKGGAEAATPATPTPPPPRASPSAASGSPLNGPPIKAAGSLGSMGPPARPSPSGLQSGPPSRAETPAGLNGGDAARSGPMAPPSRPPTSMSDASSLDDLLGGPPGPGRKAGGTMKSKKKAGRYVDVMGNK